VGSFVYSDMVVPCRSIAGVRTRVSDRECVTVRGLDARRNCATIPPAGGRDLEKAATISASPRGKNL